MAAPVLSTPAEQILEAYAQQDSPASTVLSDEQVYVQYEIQRTVREIRNGRYKHVALQFPDSMLVDSTRVYDRLRHELIPSRSNSENHKSLSNGSTLTKMAVDTQDAAIHEESCCESMCILGDTSYGACCVDEVAAEHINADVVVHYGRACLSPTARLPVIYVFTPKLCDYDHVVTRFESIYQDKDDPICLMADIPYNHHLEPIRNLLDAKGYTRVFATQIVYDPASPIPNRTVPPDCTQDMAQLKDWSIFHIAPPPTALLLTLSSRVKKMHVYDPAANGTTMDTSSETATSQLLRRRYALTMRLSSSSIFGILINTLSVSNYMQALQHCQKLIRDAGKKSYVFVVGKVNAAKIANFSEIDGWVVIGCWESSLIESKDFYRPIITPFELEIALMDETKRVWTGEWTSDFAALLVENDKLKPEDDLLHDDESGKNGDDHEQSGHDNDGGLSDSDEAPEFDLRTGKYVSRPRQRPLRRRVENSVNGSNTSSIAGSNITGDDNDKANNNKNQVKASSALVTRDKNSVARINGTFSPAAEFLRTQRTWQGLGSDYEIAYERDEHGNIRGATMEEGRSGVAKGYHVGDETARS